MVIKGIVQKGQQRGKRLGFPTANFPLLESIPEGIYLAITKVDEKKYPSLTFIGAPKTFGETVAQAETYILDFDNDIYGKEIVVELLKKIRDNQRFESEEALVKQMLSDTMIARKFFKDYEDHKSGI